MISYNEPMLFVQGPPVFTRVFVADEESTSVFILNEEEPVELDVLEKVENQSDVKAKSSVKRSIIYLEGAFQREIYRPLQFVIGDEIIKGTIGKVEGETVLIDLHGEDKGIVAVEIATIEEILWRGHSILEK